MHIDLIRREDNIIWAYRLKMLIEKRRAVLKPTHSSRVERVVVLLKSYYKQTA